MKLGIVSVLNRACTAIDAVAYRPVVVRLTRRLPRWWRCDLTRLSMYLDDRWNTGYWSGEDAPAAPGGLCDACQRRAAWLVIGGRDPEDTAVEDPEWYLGAHPIHVCGWCKLDPDTPIRDACDLASALDAARSRSIAWSWS